MAEEVWRHSSTSRELAAAPASSLQLVYGEECPVAAVLNEMAATQNAKVALVIGISPLKSNGSEFVIPVALIGSDANPNELFVRA